MITKGRDEKFGPDKPRNRGDREIGGREIGGSDCIQSDYFRQMAFLGQC